MLHLNSLRFSDGDYTLLRDQERNVALRGGWKRAYFMPDPTDAVRTAAAALAAAAPNPRATQL
jgi:hypothetical protein